jgi:uncharacterized membrane protein
MVAVVNRPSPARWPLVAMVGAAAVAALAFWVIAAAPYLRWDPAQFGDVFWPRRYGLLFHITGGTVALLVGPVQLWLGETRSKLAWHRTLGTLYLLGVTVGAVGAYYLSLTTPGAWVYAAGLFSLALAWTITTGMAYRAIRRRAIDQHREWMIRSYVVTLSFVVFRAIVAALGASGVGVFAERVTFAAWACWAVPLVLVELCLQWRKVQRRAPITERPAQ